MQSTLTAVILAYNEDRHIARCIASVRGVAGDVLVVDSFSTDDTVVLARASGARVLSHPFLNYAEQFNWALQQIAPETQWVLRIDADEYLTPELAAEIRTELDDVPESISGLVVRRRITFMRRQIRFGGFGALWVLRIWRNGQARCESRWMDEHMVLTTGASRKLRASLVDDNENNIAWWTEKHVRYASREAIDLLNARHHFLTYGEDGALGVTQARIKRYLKERIYCRLPLGVRPVLYYLFRMTVQLGLLDSPQGWAFHFLQGLWYRTLVDIKVWEVERRMRVEQLGPVAAIRAEFGIDPLSLTSAS